MRRKMRAFFLLFLCCIWRMGVTACAEGGIDAFFVQGWQEAVEQVEYSPRENADKLLVMAMEGYFLDVDIQDSMNRQVLAAVHPLLTSITDEEIERLASAAGMPSGLIRHAYYVSMTRTLIAQIAVMPAEDERKAKMQELIGLFLRPGAKEADDVRPLISLEQVKQIARELELPERFAAFVMLDATWWDADWTNDGDMLGTTIDDEQGAPKDPAVPGAESSTPNSGSNDDDDRDDDRDDDGDDDEDDDQDDDRDDDEADDD